MVTHEPIRQTTIRQRSLDAGLSSNPAVSSGNGSRTRTTTSSWWHQLSSAYLGMLQRAEGAEAGLADAVTACGMAQARIEELGLALAIKTAHAAGLEAQLRMFIAAHQESPVRAHGGMSYRDTGAPKSHGRLAYEKAFDETARGLGVANPAAHRAD